ncbi:MAG: T9SS type A sorting domain-containing protein [Candidatus Zixiibacteriota bacterium]|nr:MAG: T9SS type A sorting domain-containing protein [candidate division Zixibacteria bacterium]
MQVKFFYNLSILLFFAFSFSYAQAPDTAWTKTYGDSGYDGANCIQQTVDGGYIIGGGGFATLIKIDASGDLIWTKDYGLAARSVQQTVDGGYIIACDGLTSLIKTDENGDSVWTRDYEINPSCAYQTNDGGYIMAGSFVTGRDTHCCLLKTDLLGNAVWQQTYVIGETGRISSVQQTSDGGYIAAGLVHFPIGCWDYCLIKTDASGDSTWVKIHGAPGEPDEVYAVAQTDDGGYIMTGFYFWTVKTDEYGDTLWTRHYAIGEVGYAYSIRQTNDGGFLLAGFIDPPFEDQGQLYIVKTDNYGNSMWEVEYGDRGREQCYDAIQTNDGGYMAAGYTGSFGAGNHDVWILKFESETSVPEIVGFAPNDFALGNNYPNPFNSSTTIEFSLDKPQFVALTVYDLLGREINTLLEAEKPSGTHRIFFDASDLSSGVYFYRLQAGDLVASKRMILLK